LTNYLSRKSKRKWQKQRKMPSTAIRTESKARIAAEISIIRANL